MTKKKFPAPPVPPQFPIPPGEHLPAETREQRAAYNKYWADFEKYSAALFDLSRLQEIVAKAGAPTLPDTSDSQAVVRIVTGKIWNRHVTPDPLVRKVQDQIKRSKKDWGAVRKHIKHLADAKRFQKKWFIDRPFIDPDGAKFRDDCVSRLENFLSAMDEIEPWLWFSPRKHKGHHGGMQISSPDIVTELYNRLSWAWESADLLGDVTKEARYQIILACLELIGERVSIDAIRKIITKALKTDPWRMNKANYELTLIDAFEEQKSTENGDGKGD